MIDVIVIELLFHSHIDLFHKEDKGRLSKPFVIKFIVEVKVVPKLIRA